MTSATDLVAGFGLRYPRAYRPNRAGRQCWVNFAIGAWKSPEEPPETVDLYDKLYQSWHTILPNLIRSSANALQKGKHPGYFVVIFASDRTEKRLPQNLRIGVQLLNMC